GKARAAQLARLVAPVVDGSGRDSGIAGAGEPALQTGGGAKSADEPDQQRSAPLWSCGRAVGEDQRARRSCVDRGLLCKRFRGRSPRSLLRYPNPSGGGSSVRSAVETDRRTRSGNQND